MIDKNNRLWRDIIELYIPDDCTRIDFDEDNGMVALAISYRDGTDCSLDVYIGKNYYEVFDKSGYLEGLLDYGYFEEYTDEEQALLKQAMGGEQQC